MAAGAPHQRYPRSGGHSCSAGITQYGRGSGSAALKVRSKMFATLTPAGALAVKLPRQRVAALVADG